MVLPFGNNIAQCLNEELKHGNTIAIATMAYGWKRIPLPNSKELNLGSYLEILKVNPKIHSTAWENLYRAIKKLGIIDPRTISDRNRRHVLEREPIFLYQAFEEYFFGVEHVLHDLVTKITGAATRGESGKKAIFLLGPNGSGKSQKIKRLGRILEDYTQEFPLYRIAGCRHKDVPLLAIPEKDRDALLTPLGITIHGSVCESCKLVIKNIYSGDYLALPVESFSLSIDDKVGYGVISKGDFSMAVRSGTDPFFGSLSDKYEEDNPAYYRYDGVISSANGGVLELKEVTTFSATQIEQLNINSITMDGEVPGPGLRGSVAVGMAVFGHGSYADKATIENLASMKDRYVVVRDYLNLRLDAEKQIYLKRLMKNSDLPIHFDHDALDAVAIATLFTRYSDDTKLLSLRKKLLIYNGEEDIEIEKDGGKKKTYRSYELQKLFPEEGMTGINPRFAVVCIERALPSVFHEPDEPYSDYDKKYVSGISGEPKSKRAPCLNWVIALRTMDSEIAKEAQYVNNSAKYKKCITEAHSLIFDRVVSRLNEFLTGGFNDYVNDHMKDYLKHALACVTGEPVEHDMLTDDPVAYKYCGKKGEIVYTSFDHAKHQLRSYVFKGESSEFAFLGYDESYLRSIEAMMINEKWQVDAQERRRKEIRDMVVNRWSSHVRKGSAYLLYLSDLTDLSEIKEAIAKKVQKDQALFSLEQLLSSCEIRQDEVLGRLTVHNVVDDAKFKKMNSLIKWMHSEWYYCIDCAGFVLRHIKDCFVNGKKLFHQTE